MNELDSSLCCVDGAVWQLPGLRIPQIMLEMNYGCGASVLPSDLSGELPILYIGAGGGLEALQFAYFRRHRGGVVAVDPVPKMREAARRNLEIAAQENDWFDPEFVTIIDGAADTLPADDATIGIVSQNCLFNVFVEDELRAALADVARVLVPGGKFLTSDPITTDPLPASLKNNPTLRARCVSGCLTYERYLQTLEDARFRELVVRARKPYRYLLPSEFPEITKPTLLELVEILAIKSAQLGCC